MKKVFVTAIAVISSFVVTFSAFANGSLQSEADMQQVFPTFGSFSGTVKEINPYYDVNGESTGKNFVLAENEEGMLTNFVVTQETYIADKASITVDSEITGFYDATLPAIMIYPPQYHAEVVVVNPSELQNIKVDRFDENLLSSDKMLKLNLSDETEIVLQDGSAFVGPLTGRKLVVYYTFTTKSIPPQTTPSKIVVLFEKAVHPILEEENAITDVSDFEIVVENEKIKSPQPYTKEDGTIMVPLRAIAESLHYEVKWDEVSKTAALNNSITVTLDADQYTYNAAPVSLGTSPELVDGFTYVPLNFFTKVARMNNAYVFEGQIVIDNNEKMQ